jgi:Periplasmic binding protein
MSYRQRDPRSTLRAGRDIVSRRSLIKASVGVAMAPLFCGSAAGQTWAHMRRGALGTYPKGVRANTVFVGGVMPLSGPYLAPGMDMRLGFMLAIEHLNHGSRITERMPALKAGSGVLDKQLEFQIADSESNPSTATQGAAKFVRENQAIMLIGGVSSAVSIALERFADREHVIFMVGNSGSNNIGDDDHRHCERGRRCRRRYERGDGIDQRARTDKEFPTEAMLLSAVRGKPVHAPSREIHREESGDKGERAE